jgi:hypothetical protein
LGSRRVTEVMSEHDKSHNRCHCCMLHERNTFCVPPMIG